MIIVSAVCWTTWKHRNEVCFNGTQVKNTRTLIFLILSLFQYWSGKIKGQIGEAAQEWLPSDIDSIPIQEETSAAYLAIGDGVFKARGEQDPEV